MKVAIAQITTLPGDFEYNFKKITSYIDKARGHADLIVFSELTIPGYAHMDLANDPEFIALNKEYLDKITQETKDIAIIIGFIEEAAADVKDLQKLYNSAAIIQNQKLIGTVHKTLLPTYDIFFEDRYYTTGTKEKEIFEINGYQVGIGICEDLWSKEYNQTIYQELIDAGADLLVNISASPFEPGKLKKRVEEVEAIINAEKVNFIYSNLVGGFDGYDGEVVFDGNSFIAAGENKFLGLAKDCEEELLICDLEDPSETALPTRSTRQEIYSALILGIRSYFNRCGLKHAYVALSGGIDSAVTVALAVDALGANNVTAITMPSEITSSETLTDALLLAKNLSITMHTREIKDLYVAWDKGHRSAEGQEAQSLSKQNIQARIRGMILMSYTNEDRTGLALNTSNKTEMAMGYSTMYGDMCGGLAVISDLNKLQVYEIAEFVNQKHSREIIPNTTITRTPTAELAPGQTDADNLPADYDVLAPLVDAILLESKTITELKEIYPPSVVDKTLRLIKINEFKRRQAPPGIRVSDKAFGIGRRIPISHGWK